MLKIKPAKQLNKYFCSPASLQMVLRYFGVEKSQRELARLCKVSASEGVRDASQVVRAAKRLGFKAKILDFCGYADLKKYIIRKKIPVIVNWFSVDSGHYSVAFHINEKNLHLVDPTFGKARLYPLKKFKEVWFSVKGNEPKKKEDFRIRRAVAVWK